MRRTVETGSQSEPGCEAEMIGRIWQTVLRTRRAFIVGMVFLALMVGGAPAANAATSDGDALVQTQRFCWWYSC